MSDQNFVPRIRTIQIKNYKSLASVSVDLEPFTVFVGQNGSGKSNFVDALAFISECMSEGPNVALSRRGGIAEVVSRLDTRMPLVRHGPLDDPQNLMKQIDKYSDTARSIGFRLVIFLSKDRTADYSFQFSDLGFEKFIVSRERCLVSDSSGKIDRFETKNGRLVEVIPGIHPYISIDNLTLPLISGLKEYNGLWSFLNSLRTYSINPTKLAGLQDPDTGLFLHTNGCNAASVLENLQRQDPLNKKFKSMEKLLSIITKDIKAFLPSNMGPMKTIIFQQDVGLEKPATFYAGHMSDGTLRALGVLLAAYQPGYVPVVAIEEPESTIHPAAAEVLMDVLTEASHERQILITTHSPDILDYKRLEDHQIRLVTRHKGATIIAPLSEATRQTIRENLYTPGELLSVDELMMNEEQAKTASEQVDLFGEPFLGEA